jgi:hypothetical protein
VKINILGTEYLIVIEPVSVNKKLEECNGYCDQSIKEIHLKDFVEESKDTMALANMELHRKKVIRHEIIHAFLIESGLDINSDSSDAWANNEEMVDWIALQFPKMLKAFQDADCI